MSQPSVPTFIPAGYFAGALVFPTLADLAAELERLAQGRDLEFTPCFAAYRDFDTFPGLRVEVIDGDASEYLGTVAIQGARAEALTCAFPLARAA